MKKPEKIFIKMYDNELACVKDWLTLKTLSQCISCPFSSLNYSAEDRTVMLCQRICDMMMRDYQGPVTDDNMVEPKRCPCDINTRYVLRRARDIIKKGGVEVHV